MFNPSVPSSPTFGAPGRSRLVIGKNKNGTGVTRQTSDHCQLFGLDVNPTHFSLNDQTVTVTQTLSDKIEEKEEEKEKDTQDKKKKNIKQV
jgi:hypothetical protein